MAQTLKITIKTESVWINRKRGYEVTVIAGANLEDDEYAPALVLRTLVAKGQDPHESALLAIDVGIFVEDFIQKQDTPSNVVPLRG